MAVDSTKVLVGAADQSTTGAVLSGAVLTTIPATFADAEKALASMTDSGYVSEDGLTLTPDISTTEITEWNKSVVRKVIDSFDGTLGVTLIQADAAGWKQALGDEYVTETAATKTAGAQTHIKMGAHLAPERAWGFKMKDGDKRVIIIVPKGQVTTLDEMSFTATDAVKLPLTISAYDDGAGECIHIFMDDGVKADS